ncbi:hypothetical protein NQ318_006219 [Aromia moschata]|uniref:Chitin-binding type-2 domain-containing protein n=1 Tax=Aromia moschata TaxID=1265417 RepID=A0AAV8XU12_9CUCU|nr:hypothetical protein NQ318_006219 [Aromia moschata]
MKIAEVIFDCPADSSDSNATYFPHETECGKFYECHNGEAKLFKCPAGTYFDTSLDVCNWNVDCGNLTTSTVAPTTATEAE